MGEIVTFEFLEPMLDVDVALGLTGADAEKQDMAAEYFAIAQPLFVTFSEIRGVMLDKNAGNESQKLGELVRQFYNTYDKVGPAVYELSPASAFQKWPDHYLAWHAPTATFVQLVSQHRHCLQRHKLPGRRALEFQLQAVHGELQPPPGNRQPG